MRRVRELAAGLALLAVTLTAALGQTTPAGAPVSATPPVKAATAATTTVTPTAATAATTIRGRKGLYPIAIPRPVGSDPAIAALVEEVQASDLRLSSWFSVLDPRSFLADVRAEGLGIEPQKWKDVGAFGVVKARAVTTGGQVTLSFKLYELDRGAEPTLEREYRGPGADVRRLVHAWCNDLVAHLAGEPGFFGSRIVFVSKRHKGSSVVAMDFDGHAPHSLTKNPSINILPAWSPTGAVAFTSYMRGNADLYVTAGAGRPKRLSRQPGMNTGAAFSPDGSRVAVTLSRDGNPELYLLDTSDGSIVRRLTDNRWIDTSPAWSPDGRELAFVSNREGGPQVFVMNADGSGQKRVTFGLGGWVQTPTWNPRAGTRELALTLRDDASGHFDIVTLDLTTGRSVRITQGHGNNEEPTWAPNGRAIAFASSRRGGSGIYIANADGTGTPRLVIEGKVTSPDWGKVP